MIESRKTSPTSRVWREPQNPKIAKPRFQQLLLDTRGNTSSNNRVKMSTSHPTHSLATETQSRNGNGSSSSSDRHKQHQQQTYLSHEERLPKAWRHLASNIVAFVGKAEKAAANSTQENCKELDESVLTFLRTRMEWHRLMNHVEAKLQGEAQEMEALECYVRNQPRLGKRKRKEEASATDELQSAMQNVSSGSATPGS